MNSLRIFWIFLRIGVMNELAYRVNFVFQFIQALASLAVSLGGLAVIFAQTDALGGWRPDELLALVGVHFLVGGMINFMIQPSMAQLMEDVQQGTLDFVLTKPADSQLLVSVRQFRIWQLLDVLLGLGVIAAALIRIAGRSGENLGAGHVLGFAVALAAGTAIVYSFWLALATCSFWFIRANNMLYIFESMYEAGRWPVNIYPGWLRLTLTFLIPVAFAVTVPAQALVGQLNAAHLAGAAALAVVMLVVSRVFWKFGVRRYSGASA